MSGLFDKRLVMVCGKGGVGRTTVAAALGVLAARRGLRTMVCEVAEQERISSLFDEPAAGFTEREVAPGLFALSVSPERAQEEWLRFQLPSNRLAGLLGSSSLFLYLTAAAPGLRELVTIGKVWELAQLERKTADRAPYDVVILDAPATGHGIAMLEAPGTFREIVRSGPIAGHAAQIEHFVTDPEKVSVIAVARPEEMPVNETLDLETRLGEQLGLPVDRAIVNAVHPQPFDRAAVERIKAARAEAGAESHPALDAAVSAHERARIERGQVARLRRRLSAPVSTLPFLDEPELGRESVGRLATVLGRSA